MINFNKTKDRIQAKGGGDKKVRSGKQRQKKGFGALEDICFKKTSFVSLC